MTAKNDITGDALRTKAPNDKYAEGWDRIFGKKEVDSDDTFWYHNCKHNGDTHTINGQACSWCGIFEDGSFD
jgi:hypothetical protein